MDSPRKRGGDREPLSNINITPLVDVMLVLLIIFMVTASLGQQGITVHLPKAQANPLKVSDDMITVSIDEHLDIFVNSSPVDRKSLTAMLESVYRNRK